MTPEIVEAWALVAFAITGPLSLAFFFYCLFKYA